MSGKLMWAASSFDTSVTKTCVVKFNKMSPLHHIASYFALRFSQLTSSRNWYHLKSALNKYDRPANGIRELWDRIQVEWEKIAPEYCLKLFESMPRRMRAVIKSRGMWTKY